MGAESRNLVDASRDIVARIARATVLAGEVPARREAPADSDEEAGVRPCNRARLLVGLEREELLEGNTVSRFPDAVDDLAVVGSNCAASTLRSLSPFLVVYVEIQNG